MDKAPESEWKKNENKAFDEEFSAILAKEASSLNEHDKQFLVGRRDMLTSDQHARFDEVIEATLAANLAAFAPADEAPTKKSK